MQNRGLRAKIASRVSIKAIIPVGCEKMSGMTCGQNCSMAMKGIKAGCSHRKSQIGRGWHGDIQVQTTNRLPVSVAVGAKRVPNSRTAWIGVAETAGTQLTCAVVNPRTGVSAASMVYCPGNNDSGKLKLTSIGVDWPPARLMLVDIGEGVSAIALLSIAPSVEAYNCTPTLPIARPSP